MLTIYDILAGEQKELANKLLKRTQFLQYIEAQNVLSKRSGSYKIIDDIKGVTIKRNNKYITPSVVVPEFSDWSIMKLSDAVIVDAHDFEGKDSEEIKNYITNEVQVKMANLERQMIQWMFGWSDGVHSKRKNSLLGLAHVEIDAEGTDADTKTSAYVVDTSNVKLLAPDNFIYMDDIDDAVDNGAKTDIVDGNLLKYYAVSFSINFAVMNPNVNALVRIKNIDKTKTFGSALYKEALSFTMDNTTSSPQNIIILGNYSTISGLSDTYTSNTISEKGEVRNLVTTIDGATVVVEGNVLKKELV